MKYFQIKIGTRKIKIQKNPKILKSKNPKKILKSKKIQKKSKNQKKNPKYPSKKILKIYHFFDRFSLTHSGGSPVPLGTIINSSQ